MKRNIPMKKTLFFLCLLALALSSCDTMLTVETPVEPVLQPIESAVSATAIPTPEVSVQVTQTIFATATSQSTESVPAGTVVTFAPLSLIIPSGVATGASGTEVARNDSPEAAYWQKTPGHLQVSLGDYYVLQDKFHQPQIFVYPAQAYAELVPAAFENIHRLNNLLYEPNAPINADQLPAVPFFNAAQVFASNVQVISFQNGRGVRILTEYAQYPAPVNNYELIYEFHGVSNDGAYYIIAIMPITVPVLPETNDAGAVLPDGGVPYPFLADPNADMQKYYAAVSDLLNGEPPDAFTPAINTLDMLIQSMQINP
jgi:hypothetical protein